MAEEKEGLPEGRPCSGSGEAAGEGDSIPTLRRKRVLTCLVIAGAVAVGVFAAAVAAFKLVPFTQKLRGRGDRAAAAFVVDTCKGIAAAQETYYSAHGCYAAMAGLAQLEMVDPALAGGAGRGYHFQLDVNEDGQDWALRAWPSRPGKNTKSYYVDVTGEVRVESCASASDKKAGPDSPALMDWKIEGK